ncbi:MAG: phosphate acyltransferase PlsX, partial [Eubacteriales bacterium]|nr:phosphate acyltransferase PlsX [Eubacteriales bacterium]
MRIIIDAMGGDKAPNEIVKGALNAANEFGVDLTFVGLEEDIRRCLKENSAVEDGDHIRVVHASEVVTMEDEPSMAVRRKKDSSMTVMLNMLRDGEGDACVSAGSTGALLTGATLIVKRIRGIRRACLAPVMPLGEKGIMLIDCGANVECTPEYLLQFAYMGSFYCRDILGIKEPRIGLLNNGTEPTKGTDLLKQVNALLQTAHDEGRIRFVGNVEANSVFAGNVDVLVCDGFTGNIFLKTLESTASYMVKLVKEGFMSSAVTK